MVTGLFLFALGIILNIRANIGFPPWDVFHVGLANTIGISIGLTSILVGIVVGIFVTILGEKFGIGMIFNMVLVGIYIDLIFPHVPTAQNNLTGVIMMLAGIIVVSVGSCLYLKSAFGAGPRDSLMVALARRTKFPVGVCRGAIEATITVAGFFLGGMLGFGTAIFVVAIGFFIQITFKIFKFDPTAVKHETIKETYLMLKNIKR